LTRWPKRSLRCLLVEVPWQINEYLNLSFNILRHAASAITRDFIFAKMYVTIIMRVSLIISCPFLAKPHFCLLILCMSKLGHKYRLINKQCYGLNRKRQLPRPYLITLLDAGSIKLSRLSAVQCSYIFKPN